MTGKEMMNPWPGRIAEIAVDMGRPCDWSTRGGPQKQVPYDVSQEYNAEVGTETAQLFVTVPGVQGR